MHQTGRCLCGDIRFNVTAEPEWVTICYCRFCQKATGSAYMIEPIFQAGTFSLSGDKPRVYTHVSGGSGREVYIHFCGRCGSKTRLTFDRWHDRLGVYAGAFDDPNWFKMEPENTKFLFLREAQRGIIVPPRFQVYYEHAATVDGQALEPEVFSVFHQVMR